MNDNDLEGRLRAESGPREHGYAAAQLPDSLEDPRPARQQSRIRRPVMLAAAVVAGVLVVAGAGAVINRNEPPVGSGSSGSPQPSATADAEEVFCQPDDLEISAEPWGGAAGSRGTIVTIVLAPGRNPCAIQMPYGQITDANGDVLARFSPVALHSLIMVEGAEATVAVTWSNWCDGQVAGPVSLTLGTTNSPIPVDVPDGADPIPPCSGENMPSVLNVTSELQPAP